MGLFGWGANVGISIGGIDTDTERRPPAEPTPLDFPAYNLPDVTDKEPDLNVDSFHKHLISIKRPQDISTATFQDLNVRVSCNVPATQMIPEERMRSQPPLPWEEDRASTESGSDFSTYTKPRLMSNGSRYPAKDRWEVIFNELLIKNDDAFREAARIQPRVDRSRIRLTQSRRFWAGLERMAQYWDTSLDRYFESPATPDPTLNNDLDPMQTDGNENDTAKPSAIKPMDIDKVNSANTTDERPKPTVSMYTGRRFGAGREMPEDVREETIRGLLEMVAWPFGCQVTVPMLPPRLSVQNLLLPIRWTFLAARSPQDRHLARSGVLEGPMLVAQCRPDTSFRGPDDLPGSAQGEICDLFREIGAMLLAAQERARQGTTEVKPGEGKWWTTTPRWGGAPNEHHVGQAGTADRHTISSTSTLSGAARSASAAAVTTTAATAAAIAASSLSARSSRQSESGRKRSKFEHPLLSSRRPGSSSSRKQSTSDKWKILQPGPTLWDKRMNYMQIGKDTKSPFDDIYMVSSLNHHIAILHLRVHRRYLDILTTGKSDFTESLSDTPADPPWHVLKIERTRWFDLFVAEDRIEALKGLWRIFHYMMRAEEDVGGGGGGGGDVFGC